jgi:hypothetical protein
MVVPIIVWIIFTVDNDLEESSLDVIKDFTSLLIIIELDNMTQMYNPTLTEATTKHLQVRGQRHPEETERNIQEVFKKAAIQQD